MALGGRGDLAGSYNDTGVVFLTANFNWKFQGRPPAPRVPARPERPKPAGAAQNAAPSEPTKTWSLAPGLNQ